MISGLTISFEDICDSILQLDEARLTPNIVIPLIDNAPSQDEMSNLSKVSDFDRYKLNVAEQLILELMQIDRYLSRIECFNFKRCFNSKINEIQPGLRLVVEASNKLKDNSNFKEILAVLLAVGNYINGGSNRGGAYGFKIDLIHKLNTINSVDNNSNLGKFLGKVLKSKFPETLAVFEELSILKEAKKVNLKALESEFEEVQNGFNQLKNEIPLNRDSQSAVDRFYPVMSEFYVECEKIISETESLCNSAREDFRKVVHYYGESEKDFTTHTFFDLIDSFFIQLQIDQQENPTPLQIEFVDEQ